ncbi:hypothetical protein HYX17_03130 [Candidatus Woesearchaeota archaeon]|nr:hypothetical protein [Candidatus Woesearchaeota archaeon]
MENLYNKIFQRKRKISFDIDEITLNFIDKISHLTKSNRTMVIGAFVSKGLPILLDEMERTWQGLLIKGNLDENKKNNLKKCLNELKKIREEWYTIKNKS